MNNFFVYNLLHLLHENNWQFHYKQLIDPNNVIVDYASNPMDNEIVSNCKAFPLKKYFFNLHQIESYSSFTTIMSFIFITSIAKIQINDFRITKKDICFLPAIINTIASLIGTNTSSIITFPKSNWTCSIRLPAVGWLINTIRTISTTITHP